MPGSATHSRTLYSSIDVSNFQRHHQMSLYLSTSETELNIWVLLIVSSPRVSFNISKVPVHSRFEVFWLWRSVLMWDINVSEDAGSLDLWKVSILPHHHTVSQPRRTRSESRRFLSQIFSVWSRTWCTRSVIRGLSFFLWNGNLKGHVTQSRFTRVWPKVSGLAAWDENCKWYRSQPLIAVLSLFCELVYWVSRP